MVATHSPTQRTPVSKAHSPESVPLVQYRDGSLYAMSLTTPGLVYRVQLDPLACECLGFQHRQTCCHTLAAQARFAPPCLWCGSTVDVEVWHNGWDDSELALCRSCFTKEA